MTIAIVAMVSDTPSNKTTALNTTDSLDDISVTDISPLESNNTATQAEDEIPGSKFDWDKHKQNQILGTFFWGYILTELPGGRLAEVIGAKRVFGGGMLAASIITLLTPAACNWNFIVVIVLRVLLGFFLGE